MSDHRDRAVSAPTSIADELLLLSFICRPFEAGVPQPEANIGSDSCGDEQAS